MYKNHEGYPSPTEGEAIHKADKTPKAVTDVMYAIKTVASLAGFEIVGRIVLKDRHNGRERR